MSLDQHWNTFSSYTLSTFQQSQKQQHQTQLTSIPSTPTSASSDSQHSGYSTPSFSSLSSFPISVMNHPRVLFDKINSLADAVSRAYNDPPFSSAGTNSPKEELTEEEKRERRKSFPASEGNNIRFLGELEEENISETSSQSNIASHPNRPAPVRSKSSTSTITSQSRRATSDYITESPKTPTPSTITFPNSIENPTPSRSSSSSSETYRFRHSRFLSVSSSSSAQSSKYDSGKSGSKVSSTKGTFNGGKKSAVAALKEGAGNGGGLNMKYVAQSIHLANEALEAGGDVDYAIDCYLSSLDYLISAFPLSSPSSASHSIQLKKHSFQSKLFLLLAKLNPSSRGGLVKIPDGPLSSAEELETAEDGGREVDVNTRKGIWSIIPGRNSTPTITSSKLPQNQSSQEVLIPCEACGNTVGIDRETLVELAGEQFRLRGGNSELQVTEIDDAQDERGIVQRVWEDRPKTWQEAVISIVIHLAIFLRQSPILYLFSVFLTSIISYLLYLDAKFLIRRRVYIGGMRMFNGLAESDKEGRLSKALGEGTAVFWEALLKGAAAFSQAEPFQPPESWVINSAIAEGRTSSGGIGGSTGGSGTLSTPVWEGWWR